MRVDPLLAAMHGEIRESVRLEIFERAFSFGDFTLASGKTSKYYCDARRLYTGPLLGAAAMLMAKEAAGLTFRAVGGLEVGAIPLAAAIAVGDVYARNKNDYKMFFVRKNPKSHGARKLLEGPLEAGESVLIVDDVLTTGESALKACKAVEEFGCRVAGVVCLIDRLQGAAEALEGYVFRPVFTVRDFGIEPEGV
jgi:orotate phosphoribosyltransferase